MMRRRIVPTVEYDLRWCRILSFAHMNCMVAADREPSFPGKVKNQLTEYGGTTTRDKQPRKICQQWERLIDISIWWAAYYDRAYPFLLGASLNDDTNFVSYNIINMSACTIPFSQVSCYMSSVNIAYTETHAPLRGLVERQLLYRASFWWNNNNSFVTSSKTANAGQIVIWFTFISTGQVGWTTWLVIGATLNWIGRKP